MRRLKKIRQESVKRRKNYLPTLILTITLLLVTTCFIYFIDPSIRFAVPLFFILLFSSLLFLFSVIMGNSRRGLITSSGISFFLILRYLGVGNILNLLIIIGLCIVTEYYFGNKIK